MSNHTSHTDETESLAESARHLLAATVDVAGEKVGVARKQLSAALEKAKKAARATDKAIQQHPYKAIAIAVGAGLLLGYFLSSRGSEKANSDS